MKHLSEVFIFFQEIPLYQLTESGAVLQYIMQTLNPEQIDIICYD